MSKRMDRERFKIKGRGRPTQAQGCRRVLERATCRAPRRLGLLSSSAAAIPMHVFVSPLFRQSDNQMCLPLTAALLKTLSKVPTRPCFSSQDSRSWPSTISTWGLMPSSLPLFCAAEIILADRSVPTTHPPSPEDETRAWSCRVSSPVPVCKSFSVFFKPQRATSRGKHTAAYIEDLLAGLGIEQLKHSSRVLGIVDLCLGCCQSN